MRSSIQWKIVGIYLCVVMIIMITSGSFIIYNIEDTYYEKIEQELNTAVDNIERILGLQAGSDLEKDISEKLKTVVPFNTQKIYILDKNGYVQHGTA